MQVTINSVTRHQDLRRAQELVSAQQPLVHSDLDKMSISSQHISAEQVACYHTEFHVFDSEARL